MCVINYSYSNALVLKEVIKVVKDEISAATKANLKKSSASTKISTEQKSPFAVELEIKSCVDKRLVSAFTSFSCEAAKLMGLTLSRGPATLEPKYDRWTVLSSPFVHKTARTQFERREHCQVMKFEGIWAEEAAAKFIWYLKRHVPNEVEIGIRVHERGTL